MNVASQPRRAQRGLAATLGLLVASTLLVCSLVAPASKAGKLQQVRDATKGDDDAAPAKPPPAKPPPQKKPKPAPPHSDDQEHHRDTHERDDAHGHDDTHGRRDTHERRDFGPGRDFSSDDALGLWALTWRIVASPFWLPYWALDDHYGRDYGREGGFAPFPYAYPDRGFVLVERAPEARLDEAGPVEVDVVPKPWIGVASADVSSDFDALARLNLGGRLLFSNRIELESAWSLFAERLPGGGLDRMSIGDANVVFRFAESEHVQFRVGLGARAMLDRDGNAYGVNFTYGADILPVRPLVLSLVLDGGNLGKASFGQARATLGCLLGPVELLGGYEFMKVDGVSLSGPILGLRAWL